MYLFPIYIVIQIDYSKPNCHSPPSFFIAQEKQQMSSNSTNENLEATTLIKHCELEERSKIVAPKS